MSEEIPERVPPGGVVPVSVDEKRKRDRQGSSRTANIMILGGVLLMILATAGILLQNRPQPQETQDSAPYVGPLRAGTHMADFTLKDTDGKTVRLSDYAGRMVLINAWATWCPPCRAEMPDLNAFYQKHRASGFVVLAINAGETRDQAVDFAKELDLSFPILLDPDESLMDSLHIQDYPTSILVDRSGVIKSIKVGLYLPGDLEKEILPRIK